MKRPRLAAIALLLFACTGGFVCPSSAEGDPDARDQMLVRGGTAALLQAAGVRVPVEPDRALLVLVRRVHGAFAAPGAQGSFRPHVEPAAAASAGPELVPALLPLKVWQQAVFERDVPADDLAAAVLRDRRASFLYYGLFALDAETLAFFAANPDLVRWIHRRATPAFAAYSEGIRVQSGKVEVAGGEAAELAWERALNASPADPLRFIASLLERGDGRLAELFEALGRLDPPHLAFALGPSGRDLPALIESAAAFDSHVRLPFASWSVVDVPFLLEQVRVEPGGRISGAREPWFWDAVLAENPGAGPGGGGAAGEVTAAWLVGRFAALPATRRRMALDALLFAQRRLAAGGSDSVGEWVVPAASFASRQALFLTLEQLGATGAADYRSAGLAAGAVTAGYEGAEASRRLAIFQSAVALVARLASVGTLDTPAALDLLGELFDLAPADRLRFAGGFAAWLEGSLLARLPVSTASVGPEARLLDALAGRGIGRKPSIEWEGRRYAVDLARAERLRLERVRGKQGGKTLDEILALRNGAAGHGKVKEAASGLEALLAEVLTAHVYALLTDPDAPLVPGDGPARRHDFGLDGAGDLGPWRIAEVRAGRGATGSLLALDRPLARQALRSTMVGLPPRPPTLALEDASGLAESVVALDAFSVTDEGLHLVAAALQRGRSLLESAARRPPELDALLASAGVDAARRRLARLAAAADP